MKILIVSHSAGLLGAERSLLEIASEARADGHDVFVSTPGTGPLTDALSAAGCEFVVLPTYSWMGPHHWFPAVGAIRLWQSGRSVSQFVTALKEVEPDVVVTNTSVVPAGATAAARLRVPHVWIVRESIGKNRQLTSLRTKRSIARHIFAHSMAVCSVSTFVDDQLHELMNTRRSRIFRVQPNPKPSTTPDIRPSSRDHTFNVLLPGHLSSEKGQHRAVLALKAARSVSSRPIALHLVGRGGVLYSYFLRALIIACGLRGHVHLHGWTNDVEPHYEAADLTIFTSQNEAYGRVIVESLQHAVPVLATRRGVAPDILSSTGGEIVDSPASRHLGAALARWSQESPDVLTARRASAWRRSQELASLPSQYEQLHRVLGSVLAEDVAPS